MHFIRLYQLLTYAGALPFIGCALLLHSGYEVIPLLGEVGRIVATYALVIVSFMCGVHWGAYLYQRADCPLNLFITSNIITLIIWISFLLWSTIIVLLLSAIAFAVLLWIDSHLYHRQLITRPYFQVRRNVSVVVILSLIVSGAAL